MTTLSWPAFSVPPTRFEWWLESATQEHVSPLTGAAQTQELPGARWAARVEYLSLAAADATLAKTFISAMRGRAGRVFLGNLGQPTVRGVGGGAPLVAGAGQTGSVLAVDGGPLSVSGWLAAGDLVGVAGRMYMLTAAANTSGAGAASLSLAPPVWTAPADDAPVTLAAPTCTMMFRADRQGWTYEPAALGRHAFVFDMIEVF